MKTGLILPGGGAGGIVQFGMILAFESWGLSYDAIYGTSVGALNASMLHSGQVEKLREIWLTVKDKDVYKRKLFPFFSNSLYDQTPLGELLKKNVDLQALKSNSKPLEINSTDLTGYSARRWRLHKDPIENFYSELLASASPPLCFAPVQIGERQLSDGGLVNNYCLSNAVNDGMERLIVFLPNVPHPKPVKSLLDAFGALYSISHYCYLERELGYIRKLNELADIAEKQGADLPVKKIDVLLVRPPVPTGIELLGFDGLGSLADRQRLIQYGKDLAQLEFASVTRNSLTLPRLTKAQS